MIKQMSLQIRRIDKAIKQCKLAIKSGWLVDTSVDGNAVACTEGAIVLLNKAKEIEQKDLAKRG